MTDLSNETRRDVLTGLDRDGFAILRRAISADDIIEAQALCAKVDDISAVARRGDSVYAIRNLLSAVPGMSDLMSRPPYIDWPMAVLGENARPVHGVFFDKTADANWPVVWHQDSTIRVRQYLNVPGYEARTEKDGSVHVFPPVSVSEQMLALRIHLDDASVQHGALRVIPGSHRRGRLTNEQMREIQRGSHCVVCEVRSGDIMLMRPLLIHASSSCRLPSHRRVIHTEYAAFDLPCGLEWHG